MSQTKKIRVAVLECAEPADAIKEREGTYGDMFEKLLRDGLNALTNEETKDDVELIVSKWPVFEKEDYPRLEEVDALLLSGSQYDAFENTPWIIGLTNYIHQVIEKSPQTRLVGICFGHQIIARALGARVGRNTEGWEIAVDTVTLSQMGQKLFGKDSLSLHQMHRDIVYDLPDNTLNLGFSQKCQIQGIYRPNQLLTVQGHPEFSEYIMNYILDARYQRNVFKEEQYRDGKSRAGISHDGVVVAETICKFLLGKTF